MTVNKDKPNFNGWPVTGPYRYHENFTKSNSGLSVTNSITSAFRVYVGHSGDVSVITKQGSATYYNMPAASLLPCTDITHIMSTTTTASAFVALLL